MQTGDFRVGQRVRHSSRGAGEVQRVDREGVHVCFDAWRERGVTGIYSNDWFRTWEPKGVWLRPEKEG